MTAVEMRTDPVQCNFQPMFDPDTPALCGPGFQTNKVWSEDFEDGLAGWTAEFEFGDGGGIHAPWEASTERAGRPRRLAWPTARLPTQGQCSGDGVTDFSSRDSITSPTITLPDALTSPRLTFDHYVATEAGYDGGNVKYSVNGDDFAVDPG